ncbi:hypothetical protein E1264_18510 [Actinomadura sp. KC216]|uniref:hypothetical protein n=1 Tax=Actinomadura sp. KC216 TaxID=2530370 RepID=UPI001053A49D|nr:hypothetical protein [Actinomadura sp. KC216]TDB86286.1 hypothetical protein E1264_18510 [Actinomadura sp. KC216]
MTDRPPSGCRHCGLPERGHGQRWTEDAGWHTWTQPTDAQTKQRMLARRADRITTRAADHEIELTLTADVSGLEAAAKDATIAALELHLATSSRRYRALEAQLHAERRARLAAEAAVRRAEQVLDQCIGADHIGDIRPHLRQALTIETEETR